MQLIASHRGRGGSQLGAFQRLDRSVLFLRSGGKNGG